MPTKNVSDFYLTSDVIQYSSRQVAETGFEPASDGLWGRAGTTPVHPAIFRSMCGAGLEPAT